MISILIPVYNYDCTTLVKELRQSCILARVDYEILIGNDCSTDEAIVKAINKLDDLPNCRVVNEPKNIGRAFIVNHMAQLSAYPYLIIIDSDARVPNDDFIVNYVKAAVDHDVVCGGIGVSEEYKGTDNTLRYKYELAATKSRALEYRQKHPYEKLSTFNLLIRRRVFDAIRFDSHCYQYGYEDTVLGLDLMRQGIEIVHIDNPLIHTGIDSNTSFLHKTHMAMHVLIGLDRFYQEHIRISRTAFKLKRMNMLWSIQLWHRMFGEYEHKMLLKKPNVTLFNIYKLGYFSLLMKEKARKQKQ